jgi:hypothetical protein
MNLKQTRDYYNNKPVEYVVREHYELIEDNEYIPRFSLKNVKDIADIPINEPIKYTEEVIKKCIKYGMVLLINYKGEEDSHFAGHERVVYPMVLGKSTQGKVLLRGWHLNGWSVSNKRHINKIWRLFRADRILSITFTGSFYRLPPAGYNMNDKGMRGGIIVKADFAQIRKNQQDLVNKNKIQNREEVTLGDEQRKFITIRVKETDTKLDLIKLRAGLSSYTSVSGLYEKPTTSIFFTDGTILFKSWLRRWFCLLLMLSAAKARSSEIPSDSANLANARLSLGKQGPP